MNGYTRPLLNLDDTSPTLLVPGHASGLTEMGGRNRAAADQEDDVYEIVPTRPKRLAANSPRWRVEFSFEDPSQPPLLLEVIDSAAFGRGHTADISMDRFDKGNLGISRQHAMLRPSQRALYFFDLGSTNGTYHNGVPVGSGSAISLTQGDVIRMGRLTLTIRRLERM